ncbi:MAG TPA: FAD binding domain-containing protein [Pusillimonas sp.]|uniref:FAD binding domain-containing protein n=1 Tax=Pusillimonas sp. TaxID=3040095 RepID=UPI002C9B4CB9|nr:FAD binding domain-containing protein [Pusillimonas sp.]HUH88215.1 FAD binding domain-containing protein [Pusillimonas sp.]
MKAAKFDYKRASSVTDALGLLGDDSVVVKAMGGSQSLGPMLNLRLARPAKVVDVSGLEELRTVTEAAGRIRVGASVTHAEIEDGVFPLLAGHMMQGVAERIAYRAVRNRGTVGGSLAHADPAADWVLAAAALGATVEIVGPNGTRMVDMPEFMIGAYTTELGADELIAALHVPKKNPGARWGYYKFCKKTGEFAEASCAAFFDPSAQVARIAVGALDGAPQLLDELGARVAEQGAAAIDRDAIYAAVKTITPEKSEVDRGLCVTVVERCLRQALGA